MAPTKAIQASRSTRSGVDILGRAASHWTGLLTRGRSWESRRLDAGEVPVRGEVVGGWGEDMARDALASCQLLQEPG